LDTLISNFRESAANLINNPGNKQMYALDIYWKRLQQMHNWFMITPITVIQVQSYSDIENRVTDYKGLMLDLEKKWIFEHGYMRHF